MELSNQHEDSSNVQEVKKEPEEQEKEEEEEEECQYDTYGFRITGDGIEGEIQKFETLKKKTEDLWQKMITKSKVNLANPTLTKLPRKFKKIIRDIGIPPHWRGQIWKILSGSNKKRAQNSDDYFRTILSENAGKPNHAVEQIELDLHRTFPENKYFQSEEGISQLRNVLTAYAWRNPSVGYCQSMNFIVAVLLLIIQNEEESFWVLCCLLEDILPSEYYTDTMLMSHVDQSVFVHLIRQKFRKIHQLFIKTRVEISLITRQWFLCLFIDALQFEEALRAWDLLFNEGDKILFRFSLGLIKMNQSQLLKSSLSEDDYGMSLFQAIKELPRNADFPSLLNVAFHKIGSLSRRQIKKLRAHYKTIVAQQHEQFQKKLSTD